MQCIRAIIELNVKDIFLNVEICSHNEIDASDVLNNFKLEYSRILFETSAKILMNFIPGYTVPAHFFLQIFAFIDAFQSEKIQLKTATSMLGKTNF